MKKEILIYLAPWDHFKSESGFNTVAKRIKLVKEHSHSILFISDSTISIWERISFKLFKKFCNFMPELEKWTPFNHDFNIFRSISLSLRVLFKNVTIILLAPEDQFCGKLLTNYKLRKKCILFIHQPPSWFIKEKIDISSLKDVKQIIVLSETQRNYFEEHLSRTVILIKHGVDLNSFVITKVPKKNLVLIVGQHLRDFEAIVNTVKKVISINNDIEFHFVIPLKHRPEILNEIKDKEKIFFHDNISTIKLVELYNQAKLTFIPLMDSTANNTINESLACGTPILTNQVGDISCYISDYCGIICSRSNPEDFSAFIIKIINGEIIFSPEKIRNYAIRNIDWNKIIDKKFISKILN
jgi:glycosyltransferase involved in cell wall biosynthesis